MKHFETESVADVLDWLQSESAKLFPAILGSLSLRRSPCTRQNCPACLSGEQHPAHVLYGRLKGIVSRSMFLKSWHPRCAAALKMAMRSKNCCSKPRRDISKR